MGEVRRRRRDRECSAHAAAVRLEAEFACSGCRQEPVVEHALLYHQQLCPLDTFTVERSRCLAAPPHGLVGDGNRVRGHLLAHHVAEKAGLAGDRGAIDRAGKMTGNAARHARVEDHIDGASLGLARMELPHCALSGLAADLLRLHPGRQRCLDEYS